MPNHHEKDLTAVLVQGSLRLKAAPAGHSSRGVPDCQADSSVSTAGYGAALDEVAAVAGACPPLSPR